MVNIKHLEFVADTVRRDVVDMAMRAQAAHVGSALSSVDILVALLFGVMRIDPRKPLDERRDRLILSKGHGVAALYAALVARGFASRRILKRYCVDGGLLPGHALRLCMRGVEVTTGSLGHGLPMGIGLALARRFGVFVLMSDGECDEGTTWEAALAARQFKLGNLTAIIDYNKIQSFGRVHEVMNLEPFVEKWVSFGWEVVEVEGHKMPGLLRVLRRKPRPAGKPRVVIAHTVKGYGLAINENTLASHYKPPTQQDYDLAVKRLVHYQKRR